MPQSSRSHTFSSPLELNSAASSSSATLAAILASALADVDRLKLEVQALTNRAVSAENLLRSFGFADVASITNNSASNTNVTISPDSSISKIASPSFIAVDLTDEKIAKIANSVGDGTMNKSPSSSPLLCAKSASLFFETPLSSPTKSAFSSFSASRKPTYPLYIMPFSCQTGKAAPGASSELSAVDGLSIHNPTKSRVRPHSTSEADEPWQPPSKRLRAADDTNSSQTHSFSEQQIYSNDASSTITNAYPQAAAQDTLHSHQAQCVPLPQNVIEITSSTTLVPPRSAASISASPQQQLQQEQLPDSQKATLNNSTDDSVAQDRDVTKRMQDRAALIDRSPRSHSRSLQFEGLQLDADGELRNYLIDSQLSEVTSGGTGKGSGLGGSNGGPGAVVGVEGTTKASANPEAPKASGANSVSGQPIFKSQPQTAGVSKQTERQESTQSPIQPQLQQQQQSQAVLSQHPSTSTQKIDQSRSLHLQPQSYTIPPSLAFPTKEHVQPQSPPSSLSIQARSKRQRLSTSASQPSSSSSLINEGSSAAMKPIPSGLSLDELYKKAGLPGGYPGVTEQGLRACRQCGKAGRYQNGKCIEKWNRGSCGPGTACSTCRRKMEKVEKQMLAAQMNNEIISASDALDDVTGHGEKSNSGDKLTVDSDSELYNPFEIYLGRVKKV